MKYLSVIVLMVLACTVVLATGCTGIPGAKPAATAAPTEPTGAPGPSFAGRWMTTWQGGGHDVLMTLAVTNNVVTGTYEYGGGTIMGVIQGERLIGTWSEDNGASKGPVEFVLSADGRTFKGWWTYEGSSLSEATKGEPDWTGIRV